MSQTTFTATRPSRWPVLLTIALGALIIAAVFVLVTQRSTPLILTPGVIGLLASLVIAYAVWQGRIRNLVLCVLLALLLTAFTYSLYHVGNYVLFRRAQTTALLSRGQYTQAEIDARIDDSLRDATGSDGFVGYLKYVLKSGMVVRSGMMGPANQVTGSSLLMYWLIDVGFILFGAVAGAWLASRRPYCEHCDHYYGRIIVTAGDFGLVHLAWLSPSDAPKFTDFLNAGHFESAGALLKTDKTGSASVEVMIERCFTCETQPVVIYLYEVGSRLSTKRVLRLRKPIPPDDFDRILSFTAIEAPQQTFGKTDEGWLLSMMGMGAFLVVMLVAYSLI